MNPTRAEFEKGIEEFGKSCAWTEVLADLETPVSAYWKIAFDSEYSFLLESVTGGESLARYSFLGTNPRKIIRTNNIDPLQVLERELCAIRHIPEADLPPFVGGAVGFISYDAVRYFESLPDKNLNDLNCDDMAMMLCETVLAFDHARNRILAITWSNNYEDAAQTLQEIVEKLRMPLPPLPVNSPRQIKFVSNMSRDAFENSVRKTKDYIEAGDGVQMVISQRFSGEVSSHPLTLYRALRSVNPSPYMYLLRFGDCDVIGASPEALTTLRDGVARVRPIAGTRARGATVDEDELLEKQLLSDEKERAEHIMLVDLGRNDLGKVSKPGMVKVSELMEVEKYSHVMHIVSEVTAELRDDKNAFDLFRATFPAGTVSGAPKVRAMEIIDEFEPTRRGLYAGAIGHFGFNGETDSAIAIRTIYLKDGIAHVQAGAGIVYDSDPESEYEECMNKAAAVIRAIEMAEGGEIE